MQLIQRGEHYIWHCEKCDTRNTTLWIHIEKNQVCCATCRNKIAFFR